ncbi:sugar transferase [Aliiruegeria sabulilitoris]|uniref:sugar transferase n=1 Tax=Aliiruegeria sabulilitoris TaxID=1510458 RepID=UPI00082EF7C0|nr:sugar transferase [Aliiruegeria sabulilitoris]NDR55922.1 sugar transferase [Pseudoruegeria sp. M32A2M]
MTYVLGKPSILLQGLDGHPQAAADSDYSGKRVFDLLVVLAVMPFLLVLIGVFAFLVALDGANPFFMQRRVGRDGSVFQMIKLRTMVPDAQARLEEYLAANPSARVEWDQYQKLSHDPRVTWIGRVLRKTSLDELPQFFNVLFGDMSLVGPRPIMVEQAELYPGRAYYRMRPGITGPWQVSDRNAVSFVDRAKFDVLYLERQSLLADLGYIFRTFGAVCRMSGC